MKVVNSKGRVLLEVTKADRPVPGGPVFYSYRGDGIGGYTDEGGLWRTVTAIQKDSPSAKIVGQLPEAAP